MNMQKPERKKILRSKISYARWKKAMTEKGLKENVKKTNAFCAGERTVAMEPSKFPCSLGM